MALPLWLLGLGLGVVVAGGRRRRPQQPRRQEDDSSDRGRAQKPSRFRSSLRRDVPEDSTASTFSVATASPGRVLVTQDEPQTEVEAVPAVAPIEDRWIQVYEGGFANAIQLSRGAAARGSRNDFVTAVAMRLFPGEDWERDDLAAWQKDVRNRIEHDTDKTVGEGWRFLYWAKAPELFEQCAIRSENPKDLAKVVGNTIWPETFPPIEDDEGAVPHDVAERWERLLVDAETALAQKEAS